MPGNQAESSKLHGDLVDIMHLCGGCSHVPMSAWGEGLDLKAVTSATHRLSVNCLLPYDSMPAAGMLSRVQSWQQNAKSSSSAW